jgi:hypothetical protein
MLRAAVLGMDLLGQDAHLQESIRRQLEAVWRQPGHGRNRTVPAATGGLEKLYDERRKLLRLHNEDLISADQFGEKQARITLVMARSKPASPL